VAECCRQLDVRAEISDRDLNIFQEAIISSSGFFDLHPQQKLAVALMYSVMTRDQREDLRSARWYIDGIDTLLQELEGGMTGRDLVRDRVLGMMDQAVDLSE
jgi:hypothetical protein